MQVLLDEAAITALQTASSLRGQLIALAQQLPGLRSEAKIAPERSVIQTEVSHLQVLLDEATIIELQTSTGLQAQLESLSQQLPGLRSEASTA